MRVVTEFRAERQRLDHLIVRHFSGTVPHFLLRARTHQFLHCVKHAIQNCWRLWTVGLTETTKPGEVFRSYETV